MTESNNAKSETSHPGDYARADKRNPHRCFAFYSPTLGLVFNLPKTRHCDFTIRCKKCGENIPAPVGTMSDSWIATQCPLWGERRSYLPSEIFQGHLSYKLSSKPVRSAVL
jgi:hypothetical protein